MSEPKRFIDLAQTNHPTWLNCATAASTLSESAPEGRAHLKLKQAHRLLSERGVKAHLVPGELHAIADARDSHGQAENWSYHRPRLWRAFGAGQALNQWLPRLATEMLLSSLREQSTDTFMSIDRPWSSGCSQGCLIGDRYFFSIMTLRNRTASPCPANPK